MRPVAVVGSLTRDVVAGGPPRVGGAPYYAARALSRIPRPSFVVAKCAPEDERELVDPVRASGVPVVWLPASETPAFALSYSGDERVMSVDSLGDAWRPGDATALGDAAAVHVGALLQGDFPAETLREVAAGRLVSFDGQGLVRARRLGALVLTPSPEPAILEHVDVLKISDEEARALVGHPTPDALASLGVPEVVVTNGTRGVVVWSNGTAAEVLPPAVVADADPTGAGDTFATAYLAARLDGAEPVEAARAGAALVVDVLADGV